MSGALMERLHHHLPILDLSARSDGRVVIETLVVMVLDGDVAFAPDPVAGEARVTPGGVNITLTDLPPVVGYHELTRYLAAGAARDLCSVRVALRRPPSTVGRHRFATMCL